MKKGVPKDEATRRALEAARCSNGLFAHMDDDEKRSVSLLVRQ